MQHVMDGKQVNCLGSIQMLMKLCNHPSLVVDDDPVYGGKQKSGRRAATKQVKYTDDEPTSAAAPGADGIAKFLPASGGGGRGSGPVHPEWSGKMFVLYRLMKEMRKPGNGNDKIVIVSNYTQTLDLIGRMCRENSWRFCKLDGSIGMKKRQKMVDEFNDPSSTLIAFLLSSKAGGWCVWCSRFLGLCLSSCVCLLHFLNFQRLTKWLVFQQWFELDRGKSSGAVRSR